MSTIENTQLVALRLGRWHPGDLAFVEALAYRCADEGEPSYLRLTSLFQRRDTAKTGWPDSLAPFVRVTLLFRGVSNLQLKGFGSTPKQISGFDIIDISDRCWEGVRLLVEDYEDDQISFGCDEVVVEQVD